MTPGARAILLHSNVLYINIEFVTGGHTKHWGEQNRSEKFKHQCVGTVPLQLRDVLLRLVSVASLKILIEATR